LASVASRWLSADKRLEELFEKRRMTTWEMETGMETVL
jgi:hypothetical protein